MADQLDRFRSFSERYIIERAGKFEIGREQEQAWLALQDAKQIYGMIADASRAIVQDLAPNSAQVSSLTGLPSGPTGAHLTTATARDAAKAPPWQPAKAPPPTGILQQMASKLKGY